VPKPPPEAVLDALPIEVVILDGRGHIQACNRAWSSFGEENGSTASDWLGADYLSVCQGPDGGDVARRGIRDVLEGRQRQFSMEYPCHSPHARRWFEMIVRRLEGEGGPWVLIAHANTTDRHEAEAQRRMLWQESEAARFAWERSQFMKSIVNELAHEINTPLTSIALRLATAQGQLPAATLQPVRHSLDRLIAATRRIFEVVEALQGPTKPQPYSLVDAATLVERFRPEATRRHLSLDIALEPFSVRVDPRLFLACLTSLFTSYVLQCPTGGRVAVASKRAGDSVDIEISASHEPTQPGAVPDLWLVSARQLASQGGFVLTEKARHDGPLRHALRVPLSKPLAKTPRPLPRHATPPPAGDANPRADRIDAVSMDDSATVRG
jgi:hypothetical protein